jgi:hypothetical protein
MKIQISEYKDYQEYIRGLDRIKNREANAKLLQARKLADHYYQVNEPEIGALILRCASLMFQMEQSIKKLQDMQKGEII